MTSAARQFVQPSAVEGSCSWAPIYIIISGKFATKNLRFPRFPIEIVSPTAGITVRTLLTFFELRVDVFQENSISL